MIEIRHQYTSGVLYSHETASTVRECLELAVAAGADLGGADLGGANLGGANLREADLRGADLREADLREADLREADLSRADLRWADLSRADIRWADLGWADLGGANIRGANIRGEDLRRAKEDLRLILDSRPDEVTGLLLAIKEGRVDGSTYTGECACLVGTLANVAAVSYLDLGIVPDGSRPAERFFLGISKGDTPETSPLSALAAQWVEEWISDRPAVEVQHD